MDILNHRLIGFCGKAYSGKTTFANILVDKFDYKKVSVADALKELCAQFLKTDVNGINELKKAKFVFRLKKEHVDILANEINVDPQTIIGDIENINNNIFHNTRELMQVIGTDIIRKYKPSWHIDKLYEKIKGSDKYVIDDVRFKNELKLMKELGASMFYVIRPSILEPSSHSSEKDINWGMIENIIINDKPLKEMETLWINECNGDHELMGEFIDYYYAWLTAKISNSFDNQFLLNPLFVEDLKDIS